MNDSSWLLPETFVIRVTFTSDWHVGSGAGRPGSIDRLIARDEVGLPFVPAKTITGIWRDACERLAIGLDDGEPGAWSQCVDRVFGEQPVLTDRKEEQERKNDPRHVRPGKSHDRPIRSRLSVRPLRLPETLRAALPAPKTDAPADQQKAERQKRTALLEAMTIVQPGVKIDASTGRAEDQHLRFVEMGRTGAILTAECRLEKPDAHVSALLLAGARLVERLGGKRRRGAGECTLEVLLVNDQPMSIDPVLAWLQDSPPMKSSEEDAIAHGNPLRSSQGDWVAIPLRLTCLTPLAIHARTVGNVVESLDYVPGTYLLPHVTQTFRRLGYDLRGGIAAGELRVLPATIEIGTQPGRPVPFAWHYQKAEGQADSRWMTNRLVKKRDDQDDQEKPCREGYLGLSDSTLCIAKPSLTVRTHNTVEDKSQRPTEEVGGVYSNEAMPAGSVLRTEIRLRRAIVTGVGAEALIAALSGEARLGRSSKDDYGLVQIQADDMEELRTPKESNAGKLYVWILSDVLLRGDTLSYDPTIQTLKAALNGREDAVPGTLALRPPLAARRGHPGPQAGT